MTKLVELIELSKHYDRGRERRVVLDEANAIVHEGEIVAVRGRSGSGKTTLLNLVAGLDHPTSGEVHLDGVAIHSLSERRRTLFRRDNIGIVFQFFNLIPTLTVLENVLLPAELSGRTDGRANGRADDLLERVGLSERGEDYPDRLSGGEQQRVAIARALIQAPRLVLADEPTGNLDKATGDAVMQLLHGLTRQMGKTMILATHSHELAAQADRVLTIEAGKLVEARP